MFESELQEMQMVQNDGIQNPWSQGAMVQGAEMGFQGIGQIQGTQRPWNGIQNNWNGIEYSWNQNAMFHSSPIEFQRIFQDHNTWNQNGIVYGSGSPLHQSPTHSSAYNLPNQSLVQSSNQSSNQSLAHQSITHNSAYNSTQSLSYHNLVQSSVQQNAFQGSSQVSPDQSSLLKDLLSQSSMQGNSMVQNCINDVSMQGSNESYSYRSSIEGQNECSSLERTLIQESQALESSFVQQPISKSSAVANRFKKVKDKRCSVCGDKANGSFYGAVSCEGCKIFFRRSIVNHIFGQYICKKVNCCRVSGTERTSCKKCRFEACLKAGMKPTSVSMYPRAKFHLESLKNHHNNQHQISYLHTSASLIQSDSDSSPPSSQESQTGLSQPLTKISLGNGQTPILNVNEFNEFNYQPRGAFAACTHEDEERLERIKGIFLSSFASYNPMLKDEVIQIKPGESLKYKYQPFYNDVMNFIKEMNLYDKMTKTEINDNLEHWVNCLLVRSVFWKYMIVPDKKPDCLFLGSSNGINQWIQKDSHICMKKLFSLAELFKSKHAQDFEIACLCCVVLCGGITDEKDASVCPTGKSWTEARHFDVVSLLDRFEKTYNPEATARAQTLMSFMIDLVDLAELASRTNK